MTHAPVRRRGGTWTSTGVLGGMILTVLLVILLLAYNLKIFTAGGNAVDKQACYQSVRTSGKAKIGLGADLQQYLIGKDGNAITLDCATDYIRIRDSDEDVLKKKIADTMVDCWQMYGEGDIEVFDTKDNKYCAICSRMEFDNKKKLPRFTQYLISHNAPSGISYLDYFKAAGQRCGSKQLSEEEVQAAYDRSGLGELDTIDTASPQAVIFFMGKDAYPDGVFEAGKVKTALVGVVAGEVVGLSLCATVAGCVIGGPVIIVSAVAGVIIGYSLGAACTSDYDAYIMLRNYSDIKDLPCTQLESKSAPLTIREG